jgi:hypothetical protein
MQDLAEHFVVDVVHTDAVAEGEGRVEGVALDVGADADFEGAAAAVAVEVSDDAVGFQVEHVVVAFDCRTAEGGSGGFSFGFA